MITAISDFASKARDSSIVALAVMSHGDLAGNICGNDQLSTCSVQEVVEALCRNLPNQLKVQLVAFDDELVPEVFVC